MIIRCAQCKSPVTKDLNKEILEFERLGNTVLIREGHATKFVNEPKGNFSLNGLIGVNENEINKATTWVYYPQSRNGCCGHIGEFFCKQGHPLGTAYYDCWINLWAFRPENIALDSSTVLSCGG